MKLAKKTLISQIFLFFLGFTIVLLIFSIYPVVKITNALSIGDCIDSSDQECIKLLKNECKGASKEPTLLVIPRCDQTPDSTKTIKDFDLGTKDDKGNPIKKDLKFDEYCNPVRPCGLEDFVQLFVNLAQWGWWIFPSLALLLFIWGGFTLLTSAGNSERIQQGKRMLTSVLIGGLIILVLAWVITGLVVWLLTGSKEGVIPGTGKPWHGGEEATPETGCCVFAEVGCRDSLNEETCKNSVVQINDFGDLKNISGVFQGQATKCSGITDCQNLAVGCCVTLSSPGELNYCKPVNSLKECAEMLNATKMDYQCLDVPYCTSSP